MVNPDGSTDPGLDKLKSRQRDLKTARRQRKAPAPQDPLVLTDDELARPITSVDGLPATLAAGTITPSIVSGPFAADQLDGYVVAERDALVNVIPRGCTTEVTTVLWHAGDRVLREVHDAHWNGVEASRTSGEGA